MLCADRVPIVSTHFRVRRPKRALPIPGNDRICITSSCPRQSVCSVHAASNSVGSLYLSLRTMMAQAIRAIFWRAVDHEGEVLEKLTRISPSAPAGKPSTPYASLFSCSTRTYGQWSQWCVSVYTTRADLPLFPDPRSQPGTAAASGQHVMQSRSIRRSGQPTSMVLSHG